MQDNKYNNNMKCGEIMKINVTDKDKKLIFYTVVFIIIVVPLWFVLKPAVARSTEIKAELTAVEEQKTQMENEILKYFSSVNTFNENTEKYNLECAELNPIMENNQVDKLITDIVTSCNMSIKTLTINKNAVGENVAPYSHSQMALAGEEENGQADTTDSEKDKSYIYTTTVSLAIEGNIENMYRFMDKIADLEPAIRASFYIPRYNSDGSVSLSTSLTVYMANNI